MAYIQDFGGSAHVAQARQRVTELSRQEADEKAWADAVRAGTAAAYTRYIQDFSSGAHIAEARQRSASLEEQTRKEEDEKEWAHAMRAGTGASFRSYVQKFPSGAHVAEARQRAAALETQGRGKVPTIDIQKTCKTAAAAMLQLMGGSTAGNDTEICLGSEQRAREQLVKDWDTYSARDRARCVRTGVYLPSYVEWLTCLEMERDARKMNSNMSDPRAPVTLPIVKPGTLW
ncbi:MAG: hypothetical protein ACJ8F3_08595 [Xanthobacteraceae bacterium]